MATGGPSRPTAQRYLADLAAGRAPRSTLRYGSAGRPQSTATPGAPAADRPAAPRAGDDGPMLITEDRGDVSVLRISARPGRGPRRRAAQRRAHRRVTASHTALGPSPAAARAFLARGGPAPASWTAARRTPRSSRLRCPAPSERVRHPATVAAINGLHRRPAARRPWPGDSLLMSGGTTRVYRAGGRRPLPDVSPWRSSSVRALPPRRPGSARRPGGGSRARSGPGDADASPTGELPPRAITPATYWPPGRRNPDTGGQASSSTVPRMRR